MTKSPWSPVITLGSIGGEATDTPIYAENKSTAVLSDGRIVVTWTELGVPDKVQGLSIRAQILNADGSIASEVFQVNSPVDGATYNNPTAVALANGGFAIAFDEFSASNVLLQAVTYGSNGARVKDTTLSQNVAGVAHIPSAVATPDGHFIVVSAGDNGVTKGLEVTTCTDDLSTIQKGTWYQNKVVQHPAAGLSTNGDFLSAVSDNSGIHYIVQHPDGSTVTGDFAGASVNSATIDIVALDGGNFLLTWGDLFQKAVLGSIIKADGTATAPFTLAPSQTRFDMEKSPGGGFVLTFFVGNDIHIRPFDKDGVPSDDTIIASTNGVEAPSITALKDGRYIVEWVDSTRHIQSQIFDPRTQAEDWTSSAISGEQHGGTLQGDHLNGFTGPDALFGAAGNDFLNGGANNDTLDGGKDSDVVEGGAGADRLHGGADWDTLSYEHSGSTDGVNGVTVNLLHPDWSSGNDAQGDVFDGFEAVLGSAYKDLLVGDDNGNVLDGGNADDVLDGAGGADRLDGGAGFDRATYLYNTPDGQGVVVDLSDSTKNGGAATGDVLTGIESVQGTNAADTLVGVNRSGGLGVELLGEGGDDTLVGKAGNDTLNGGAGNDVLDGGAGGDRMEGGAGNDTYLVDSASDQIIEAAGGGTDTAIVSMNFSMNGLANVEIIKLADGTQANRLSGGAGNDHLVGNTNFNIIDGGAGADTMEGGSGNDVFIVDSASDVVIEKAGDGTDAIQTSVSYSLVTSQNIEYLTALGSGAINLTGNQLANTLSGNAGANVLDGGTGADTLDGGAGNDTFVVDNAGDVVVEGADGGADTVQASVSYVLAAAAQVEVLTATGAGSIDLTGNGFANTLTGNEATNSLKAAAGDDAILAGGGNDRLSGGLGRDTLTGGTGKDVFVFDAAVAKTRNANVDTITDFSVREKDKIALDHTIFKALGKKAGALKNDMFALKAAGDKSDHVIYNAHNGKLFYDADGAGGQAAIQIAQLKAHLHLDYHSFVVV